MHARVSNRPQALTPPVRRDVTRLDIASRVEPFVDDALIDKSRNVSLKLHPPTPREVCIRFNKPWEGMVSGYVTVLEDQGAYRMYYRGSASARDHVGEVTCVAVSTDGLRWTRPELGLYELDGSSANNIVWMGESSHNFGPFVDANPDCKPSARYKAFGSLRGRGLVGFSSRDGYSWKQVRKQPLITQGAFDSLNTGLWNPLTGQYMAWVRTWTTAGHAGPIPQFGTTNWSGFRSIGLATSPDFINWSDTMECDYGNTEREHLYTNAIVPYPRAPHIFIGFPKRFMPTRKLKPDHPDVGISDGVFICSRDGLHWDRRFMEAFIRPGRDLGNWGDRSNCVARGVLQTAADELSIYYSEHYRQGSSRMRRATVRLDGFVSVNAPHRGGEFTTVPLTFTGSRLVINYATSAAGSVQVEVRDAAGKPIPGFGLRRCREIYGDEIERTVTWNDGADLTALAGRSVRLRFLMKDADLYSLQFV